MIKNFQTVATGKGSNPLGYLDTVAVELDRTVAATDFSLRCNVAGAAGVGTTDPVALAAAGDILEEIATSGLMWSGRAAAISELTRAWQLASCYDLD